ncbi:MAG: tRNA (adenosine(37)-N6)-threonylcarbamoyltransferase complex ATPase subunit type 1 TsaE [marine benthic group bacterium]|mgnify:FL=1|nr:tRNA (adenosine(37)-N6)-threonylcarbamoyltransferase complex ATPase subunit type 1 TsaE [Gemmatimonadota bacterium]MCL7961566.1 tRNA (adenosine(37)-N6)-threonylcarbamoyltransferase complex ATPase subunit type 1 TsaE [Candidatus Carthagonibacter metallireducens]MCL7938179.1 tRNA (adenosine(37)-N6)-threonylcarbamoyltransferase complex ATPase subunit type 1 TsaE [Gemmatimonadota bacterium]MCL7958355.1 tRNA (adenosine(37)-N6)-threonylcarbamoyltransferase complex ATPase subunit type 1 TsaE [Gemmat
MTGATALRDPASFGPVDLDESALESWAAEVGRAAIRAGRFVCLSGPLGAGKSTFVRAACRAAGVEGAIPSPTFTLVNRHRTTSGEIIWHADLYRLESPELLVDVGWPELVDSDAAVFVEWAERAEDWLPADRWEVRLDFADRPNERRVEIRASGAGEPPPAPTVDPC